MDQRQTISRPAPEERQTKTTLHKRKASHIPAPIVKRTEELKEKTPVQIKVDQNTSLNRIFEYIQFDDIVLLFLLLVLIDEGWNDDLLFIVILYLFLDGLFYRD